MRFLLPMILISMILTSSVFSSPPEVTYHPEELLLAIRWVESSFDDSAIGDGGKAIGPFQIWQVYWVDAAMDGQYRECFNYTYAKEVVRRYMVRYAKIDLGVRKELTLSECEKISRIHNHGPRGHLNPRSIGYWHRVKRELEKRRLP